MGTVFSKKKKSKPDKFVLVPGYCRMNEMEIPSGIQLIIIEFVCFRDEVCSKNIISEEHMEILCSMNIIIIPRGEYKVGEHKLMIYREEKIAMSLKEYKKNKPKHKSIELGFTDLLCYKMGEPEQGIYYYHPNAYYRKPIGGMNGLDAEDSYKSFENGQHLNGVELYSIIDAANKIWIGKQRLMGEIPFEDSDDNENQDTTKE